MSELTAAIEAIRQRDALDQRMFALLQRRPSYCVDAAKSLRVEHSTAKLSMERLRRAGLVKSWLVLSPGTPRQGRRYYGVSRSKPPQS